MFAKIPANTPQSQTISFIFPGEAGLGSKLPNYSFGLERESAWGLILEDSQSMTQLFSATLEQTKISELLIWNKRFC